jgi:hypothetical protein
MVCALLVSSGLSAEEFVPYVTLRGEKDPSAQRTLPLEDGQAAVAGLPVGRYRVAVTDAEGQVVPESSQFSVRWNTQVQGRLLARGTVPGTGVLPAAPPAAAGSDGQPGTATPAMPALVAVEAPEAVLELRVMRREQADKEPEAGAGRRAGINTSRSNAKN